MLNIEAINDAELMSEDNGTMPVRTILQIYAKEAMKIFGDKLKAVILYGSYARGDFDSESDIDIMMLLKIISRHHRFTRMLRGMVF